MSGFETIIMEKGGDCVPLQILVFILITSILSEVVEILHLIGERTLSTVPCYDSDTVDILLRLHMIIVLVEMVVGIIWYMIVQMLCNTKDETYKNLAWILGPLLPLVLKVALKITVPLLFGGC
jgi:hypothetical protein